jgi:DNA-binding response OmpR family regulator
MNKPRILIVDDEPNVSRLVAVHLQNTGLYEVRTESRSYAATATAREFRPDLVFLDVDMPGKDGGDVAAEIQADRGLAGTKIVFLTSLIAASEAGSKATTRGGFRFLSKPTSPAVLDQTIREMLAQTVRAAA